MSRSRNPDRSFWAAFTLRLVGIVLAGLAMILLFREVVVPALKGDVERAQREHAPTTGPGAEPAR